jgi:hypothetical protein
MEIQPIQIWNNGQTVQATNLNVIIINDNLKDTAVLYWQLLNASEQEEETVTTLLLTDGNFSIDGDNYTNWDGNNLYPYQFVAENLNITLL